MRSNRVVSVLYLPRRYTERAFRLRQVLLELQFGLKPCRSKKMVYFSCS